MHQSSMDKMGVFKDKYLGPMCDKPLRIYDLGSFDVNGSYHDLFAEGPWAYSGVDMTPGKNVDIVLENPYRWDEIGSRSADVLISGQAFEHIEYFWITMLEIARILKPGGLCCLIAPSGGFEHRYPVDCWRYYPDGFEALARFAKLEVLENSTQWEADDRFSEESNQWQDSMIVCRKPSTKGFALFKQEIQRRRLHRKLLKYVEK
ncbi:putative SAM-dependent methyltransferase [Desulforapulum autotrophicum HRM2]|uniref:SAM-dependent methyltransferase n=1 Tax=Desulforapulum autotrophicum (strain ATCC 43914 / DSM 3382 / VKM B-1955 / HRM2) TaxID=177437 RepID=C0QK54_DESAH|nr:methyltransferase domain-containing protein [Desulforapulum autotrophicum]ACN16080.1 putative SAM-dependent methyltransferase [Desulforapulum autotrophicum HRM2]